MSPNTPVVRIRDLRFRYPGTTQDTLQIPVLDVSGRGLIALTGPSGAGKSTLIELLAGTLREPYAGSVRVLGTELRELIRDADRQRHVRRIGLIPQDYGLLPGRTIEEILRQDLSDAQVPAAEHSDRIMHALAQVGLSEFAQRSSERLSGGQRQRVAIARMLARDVDLVIADEPTANLDPQLVGETLSLFRTLGNRVAIIIVTHDGSVAEQCDRTIVLQAATAQPESHAEPREFAAAGMPAILQDSRKRRAVVASVGVVLIVSLFGGIAFAHNQLSAHTGQQTTPVAAIRHTIPTATPTALPTVPPTAMPTSSGTTPQGYNLASDQSGGYEYQPPSDPWWIAVSCVPESDAEGSVAVRVLDGSSGQTVDFGLLPCDDTSHMFAVGGSYGLVEICEDSDFGPAPEPTGYVGPAGTACQEGAVKWTLVTPVQVTSGPFGWG